jgi:hypothetical protein
MHKYTISYEEYQVYVPDSTPHVLAEIYLDFREMYCHSKKKLNKQQLPPKRRCTSTRLHGVTSQMTVFFTVTEARNKISYNFTLFLCVGVKPGNLSKRRE